MVKQLHPTEIDRKLWYVTLVHALNNSLNGRWVMTWTSSGLTHIHGQTQTHATTIPEGQNWLWVKINIFFIGYSLSYYHSLLCPVQGFTNLFLQIIFIFQQAYFVLLLPCSCCLTQAWGLTAPLLLLSLETGPVFVTLFIELWLLTFHVAVG